MADLAAVVDFCDRRTRRAEYRDFPGAENGLQVQNNGTVTKIGAAVDAGLIPFEQAAAAGVNFLIVHHGLFWDPPVPVTAHRYQKLKTCLEQNLAVYSSHLPLDGHPEIGNNAILAKELGLAVEDWFVEYEGMAMAALASGPEGGRTELALRLQRLFPETYQAIEYGSAAPERIAILTGSGRAALDHMSAAGVDTLITGELRQNHFNLAQEMGWNLYPCGHYATEVFGVRELAREVAEAFGVEWTFLQTDCRL
ncbi:MAG: Nif3-like dinuclear metal center hexameric protein [Opitutales bacterium]